MTFTDGNNVLFEMYDEFEEVYGCVDASNELVRCYDCIWAECPMRGKRKDAENND